MISSEEKYLSSAERKAKIRERYKGVNPNELNLIPAVESLNLYNDTRTKRVAVYARVSTDDPNQTSSYELQKNHYTDVVARHEGWELSQIYADEGISGTSLQHRDSFVRMIHDCQAGKIDLIITKTVARFARNVLDCIGYVRELKKLQPPIGVFFETENLYTLDSQSEMSLTFIATLAQEESHNKSDIMNASIEMRFRRGIFLTPPLLGYDHDEEGNLVVNEDEAVTVRLIFFMYLYGYTCVQIAETLTRLGRRTKKGNTNWSPGSILQQLENERHCGDVLARKTWTPSYLDHRSKKNRHERNQYLMKDHHEAIISRDDFIAVQRLISNAKYGGNRILPQLSVVDKGILKGFVIINPRWSGFSADDYKNASLSVYEGDNILPDKYIIEVNEGDFDLRNFERVRAELFNTQAKTRISFTTSMIRFSAECLKKLSGTVFVEMLIHPELKMIAVRPIKKDSKNAIKWCMFKETSHQPKSVSGKAFLPILFELLNWDNDCKYSVRGERITNGTESILLFKLSDTEIFFSDKSQEKAEKNGAVNEIHAYPNHWTECFGDEYYRAAQVREMLNLKNNKTWNTECSGIPFITDELEVTPHSVLKAEIKNMIEITEKADDNDE